MLSTPHGTGSSRSADEAKSTSWILTALKALDKRPTKAVRSHIFPDPPLPTLTTLHQNPPPYLPPATHTESALILNSEPPTPDRFAVSRDGLGG